MDLPAATAKPGPVRILDAALVIAVSTLFTAFGLWMAVIGGAKERKTGIASVAFFGLCLATGVWILLARLERRRSLVARDVEIVGSVPFPMRVGRFVAVLGVVSAVMATLWWAASPSERGIRALAAGFAVLCAGLALLLLLGPARPRAIVFEPGGLRLVEPAYDLLVPWGQIEGARIMNINDTLLVALTLRSPGELAPVSRARRGDPAAARRRLARAMALSRKLCACDLSVGPAAHGLDPVLFLRAIETYVTDPAARSRLAPRPALDARTA